MQQGPRKRSIPQFIETVCNGCEYLKTHAGVRGHNHVTNSFFCKHPDILKQNGLLRSGFGDDGKMIAFNVEGSCITPGWCPFLKPISAE